MNLIEDERNKEAYQYALKHNEISLDKLLRYGVSPSVFKSICWQNGYFVERVTGTSISRKVATRYKIMFWLVKREERRYTAGGIEITACNVPKEQFRISSGEYKCLHYKHCQCYLNGNCNIGG